MPLTVLGRLLLAALAGYLVAAGFQVLFLEVLLGGRVEHRAPALVLLGGLAGTVVSGFAGGFTAAWIGGAKPLFATAALMLVLLADTVFVLSTDEQDPRWFLLGGSATILLATAAGGWIRGRSRGLPARPRESDETNA